MEAFGVALFGAVAVTALGKLRSVIDERFPRTAVDTDATSIINEVRLIHPIIEMFYRRANSREVSDLQTACIAILRRLAHEIEDAIDCFVAKKTTPKEFAQEVARLKGRSVETRNQIVDYLGPIAGRLGGTASRTAEEVDDVPTQLHLLLNDPYPITKDWLGRNLDCLLYLCLFPREHSITAEPLIRRWLAEGLVQEDHAVENLEKLANSSFLAGSIQRSNNGKVKECQPTCHMLQCISHKSMLENFIRLCDGRDGPDPLQLESARRLSVYLSADGQLILPENLSRLRTLAVFTDLTDHQDVLYFDRFEMLRVLDLKECASLRDNDIQVIWNLALMKYLSINLGSIDWITRDIMKMKQLETLDLSGSTTVTVFKEVLLLPKLKHLLGKVQLSISDTTSVPIIGWVKSDVEKFLKDKSVLETLEGFVTDRRLGFPQLMRRMRRLRKVKIWCKSGASEKNLRAISRAIWEFSRVAANTVRRGESLSIDFEGCSEQFLNTKHPNAAKGKIGSLELRGHLTVFPEFVAQLTSIEELCLFSTGLSWEKIREGLSTSRGLKYLKLIEDELKSLDILVEKEHLRAIKRIYIVCKEKLEVEITVTQLVSVHILCHDLQVIPGKPLIIDITHMKNLKEVGLHDQVADTLKDALRQAADGRTNEVEFSFLQYPS